GRTNTVGDGPPSLGHAHAMVSSTRHSGFVSLLGAGPGDPGLITERAAQRLREADLVLYDALVHPALLERAPSSAEIRYVGKRAGRQNTRQAEINAAMIEAANDGKRVARLKGGDPYLFGRGSEEAEALAKAGVPFEVVPGVPSPLAATAYAGISLTHRSLASSVAYLTATESPEKDRTSHNWAHLATATETLVIFMGMRKLGGLMKLLVEHGRPSDTPVAVIHAASTPSQKTVVATVETIAEAAEGLGLPSLIVVGRVVTLREHLRWFDKRPLFGRRVLVPRPAHQGGQLAALLSAEGAEALCVPAIRVLPPEDSAPLKSALGRLATYDWTLFTSPNAVRFTLDALSELGGDLRRFGTCRVACIGAKTKESLAARGLVADLVATEAHAEGFAEALLKDLEPSSRLLLPRAKEAREILPQSLRAAGHTLDIVTAYETHGPSDEGRVRLVDALTQVDAVALSSSSMVRELHLAAPEALAKTELFSIGPVTSQTAEELGYSIAGTAQEASMEGLVSAIVARYEQA
ncbi:MAG: uroporphyrinogen III methyltransferase/synthase, partial [Polyangiales bacterium]